MTDRETLMFRSLADPSRRAIFERLCREGGATVGALTESAGISQPAVSKHLRQLKEAGLVQGRVEGRQTRYTPDRTGLAPLADWTLRMAAFWEDRLDGLEDLLNRMDR